VIQGNRLVSRDWLVEALWPENRPADPVASLRSYASMVHRAFEEAFGACESPAITSWPGGYLLHIGDGMIDSERFVALVGEAERDLKLGGFVSALEHVESALALLRGEPYEDAGDMALAASSARRIRDLEVEAREMRLESLLAVGRHDEVVADADRLLASHPFRERLWAVRARALALSGRATEASATIAKVRELLLNEFGIDVSPALAVVDAVLEVKGVEVRVVEPRPEPAPGGGNNETRRQGHEAGLAVQRSPRSPAASRLSIAALGPLVLERGGEPLVLSRRKARELFVYLLLNRDRRVSVDAIEEALWEDRPPKAQAQAIRSYVSMIRKALSGRENGADGEVRSSPGGYTLEVDEGGIDLVRFERLVTRARRLLADGSTAQALADVEHAIALVRGVPLADAADRLFAAAEIARLSELHVRAQEERGVALLELGQPEQVVTDLSELAEEHPDRERLAGVRIVAMYRAGRQVEALGTSHGFIQLLATDYRDAPSPRFRDLETALLTHAPDAETAALLRALVLPE
jgi:DNA-binding SARP family transcriptional activator